MDPQLLRIVAKHGVWLRREATDLGYVDTVIQPLVDGGVWHRVHHGCYTYTELWGKLDAVERYKLLNRAAYRRSNAEVALSHLSSACEWGAPLWDVPLDVAHLTRRDGRAGRRTNRISQHRGKILEGDWELHNGLWVMSPTRTCLELTTILDVEHSLVEIEGLIRCGLTSIKKLSERYEAMASWPDTRRTDFVLRLLSECTESVFESRCGYFCWRQQLPRPQFNYEIVDGHGDPLFRVDLAWPELKVFGECDGRAKYLVHRREGESLDDFVERERQRQYRIMELTGWLCIRLVWADLYRPEATAARIRAVFALAARPGA